MSENPGWTGPRAWRRRGPLLLGALALAAVAVAALVLAQPAIEEEPADVFVAEPPPEGFLDGGAGFAVQVRNLAIPYETFAVFALPRDTLQLEALFVAGEAELAADGGVPERLGPRTWRWVAPAKPGLTRLRMTAPDGEILALHAFTLTPFDHTSEALDGYPIGDYPDQPLNGNPVYDEPPGFVRVTPELADVAVSPHFTLGQFLAKQTSGWPKYLALDEDLLLKLERILYAVNEAGVDAQTLSVLSGFRTPAYNAAIGNTTIYSRHLYGDAADVFVDADGDGQMDDVTGDGEVTRADAEWLAAVVDGLADQPWYQPLVGGLGVYGPAPHRGPFIHVDTRGEPVRW
ncbi:MAG: hypothetical protein Rubg2KO_01560 [Rubricoccaceae bacterium]